LRHRRALGKAERAGDEQRGQAEQSDETHAHV
jgi:hypothetical protein